MSIQTEKPEAEIAKERAKWKRKLRKMHKEGATETTEQALDYIKLLEEKENIVIFEPTDKIWEFAKQPEEEEIEFDIDLDDIEFEDVEIEVEKQESSEEEKEELDEEMKVSDEDIDALLDL